MMVRFQNGSMLFSGKENRGLLFLFLQLSILYHPLPDGVIMINSGDRAMNKSGVWSWTKSAHDLDVLMPYWSFTWNYMHKSVPWNSRKNVALFRGSDTGSCTNFSSFARYQLVTQCLKIENCDAKFSQFLFDPLLKSNPKSLLGEHVSYEDAQKFKYQFWVDGWGAPSSRSLMTFGDGSLILKQKSEQTEFWYDVLEHGVNMLYVNVFEANNVSKTLQNLNNSDSLNMKMARRAIYDRKTKLNPRAILSRLHLLYTEYVKRTRNANAWYERVWRRFEMNVHELNYLSRYMIEAFKVYRTNGATKLPFYALT